MPTMNAGPMILSRMSPKLVSSLSPFAVVEALDPAAEIDKLFQQVHALASIGAIPGNQVRPLLAPLESARQHVGAGRNNPAINQLNAFTNKVRALQRSRRISAEDAADLIAAAEKIIDLLEGTS